MGEQGRVPFIGSEGLRIEVVQGAARPQAPLQAKAGAVEIQGDGVGRIGLQLDRVGPRFGRRVDQLQRPLQASVMVSGKLGYDERRLIRANGAAGYGERRRHVILLPFRRATIGDTR